MRRKFIGIVQYRKRRCDMRPRLEDRGQVRAETIHVRVTANKKRSLSEICQDRRMNSSEFIREYIQNNNRQDI